MEAIRRARCEAIGQARRRVCAPDKPDYKVSVEHHDNLARGNGRIQNSRTLPTRMVTTCRLAAERPASDTGARLFTGLADQHGTAARAAVPFCCIATSALAKCITLVIHLSPMTMDTLMPKTGYITARVDHKLKARAETVLRKVGVSTTELITMLLHQVVLRQAVPFDIEIPNKETQKAMRDLDTGKGESFSGTTREFIDSMLEAPRKRGR